LVQAQADRDDNGNEDSDGQKDTLDRRPRQRSWPTFPCNQPGEELVPREPGQDLVLPPPFLASHDVPEPAFWLVLEPAVHQTGLPFNQQFLD
jgi:hypothetical protein